MAAMHVDGRYRDSARLTKRSRRAGPAATKIVSLYSRCNSFPVGAGDACDAGNVGSQIATCARREIYDRGNAQKRSKRGIVYARG